MGHLVIKGLLAGFAAGVVVSFAALNVALPSSRQPTLSQARSALQQTLLGGCAGTVLGLIIASREARRRRLAPWTDWRAFVVRRKQPESVEITSFELAPVDGGPLNRFQPGQFLTLELIIPGQVRPVIRTYSLSDYPLAARAPDHYRLSIKREPPPRGLSVPPGLASNHMHDHVREGTVINVRPPAGRFVLDTSGETPIVLVSNGVGITPMLAMVKAALELNTKRQVWFVHGCRNGQHHAFRSELEALAQKHNNLHLHIVYSQPQDVDHGRYQSQGYVDGMLLQNLIKDEATYYICGSPGFMDSLIDSLTTSGVAAEAIRFESFGTAKPAGGLVSAPADQGLPTRCTVKLSGSGRSITWNSDASDQSLLELAEANGLQPPFSCRAGVCGTCSTRVINGDVVYLTPPTATVEPGSALICIARPASDTLELEL